MQSCFMGLELKGGQMEAGAVWFGASFTHELHIGESKRGIMLTRRGTCAAGSLPELLCRWFPALHTPIPGDGVRLHMETALSHCHKRLLSAPSER